MSRKKARELALHLVFEAGFQDCPAEDMVADRLDADIMKSISGEIALYAGKMEEGDISYIRSTVCGTILHRVELDEIIEKNSHGWQLSRLSHMTAAILRLALYEMHYVDDVPIGAAINEAVELAKTYESDESGAFINGILGTVGREPLQDTDVKAEDSDLLQQSTASQKVEPAQ